MFAPFAQLEAPYRRFRNSYIVHPHGTILSAEGYIRWKTTNEQIYWHEGAFKWQGESRREPPYHDHIQTKIDARKEALRDHAKSIDLSEAVCLSPHVAYVYFCHPFGWHAYGHLWDSVQRLYQLRNMKLVNAVMITSDFRRVSDFTTHAKLLGFDEMRIFPFLKQYKALFVPDLIYGELIDPPTVLRPEFHEWLMERYVYNNPSLDRARRIPGIYLDRNHMRFRHVNNNDEVRDFLLSKGFVMVDGTESLNEMLQLFWSAECVVGAHGAAFVNTIFCNEDARIYEYNPANRPHVGLRDKTRLSEHYEQILVSADADFNIDIDIKQLKELVAN